MDGPLGKRLRNITNSVSPYFPDLFLVPEDDSLEMQKPIAR